MHYPDLKLTSSSEKHGFWSKESATDRGSWSRMKINSSVAKGHSSGTEAESSDTKRDFSDMKAKSNDMKAKRTDSMSLPVRPTITISHLAFDPPKGWTNDPEEMMVEENYRNADSEGHEVLLELELQTATPIMSHSRQNGGIMHIFESGGNYYLWNLIEGTTGRFLNISFEEILKSMTEDEGGIKGLQLEDCF